MTKASRTEDVQGWRDRAIIVLLAVATTGVLLLYAPPWAPLGRDSGVFAYIGWQMGEGALPYRDIWDHKPPAIHWLNALAVSFPAWRWNIWAMSTATTVATVVLAAAVLIPTFGRRVGLLCAALHAAIFVDPRIYQDSGNLTEVYGCLLQWVILWGVVHARGAARLPLAVAGLAAGTSLLFKPTTAGIAIAIIVDLLVTDRRAPRRVARLAAFLAGSGSAVLLAALWLAYNGILSDAVDCVGRFNAAYATPDLAGSIGAALYKLVSKEPFNLLGLLTVASFIVPGVLPSGGARLARIACIALPFELLLIAAPGRFYGHYYATLLPVLTVRAATFLAAIPLRSRRAQRLAVVVGTVLLALAVGRLGKSLWRSAPQRYAAQDLEQRMVLAVSSRTQPSDQVLVWGAELGVNFLAQRPTVGPYGYAYPLFTPGYTTDAMWRRFVTALQRSPPRVIVDASRRAHWPLIRIPTLDALPHEPAIPDDVRRRLGAFLERYRKEPLTPEVDVWTLG